MLAPLLAIALLSSPLPSPTVLDQPPPPSAPFDSLGSGGGAGGLLGGALRGIVLSGVATTLYIALPFAMASGPTSGDTILSYILGVAAAALLNGLGSPFLLRLLAGQGSWGASAIGQLAGIAAAVGLLVLPFGPGIFAGLGAVFVYVIGGLVTGLVATIVHMWDPFRLSPQAFAAQPTDPLASSTALVEARPIVANERWQVGLR